MPEYIVLGKVGDKIKD